MSVERNGKTEPEKKDRPLIVSYSYSGNMIISRQGIRV